MLKIDTLTGNISKHLVSTTDYINNMIILSNGYLAFTFQEYNSTIGIWVYEIQIWDTESGTLIRTLTLSAGYQPTSRSSLPNEYLAIGMYDGTIQIWDTNAGQLIITLTGHTGAIYSLVALSNGDLASGSTDTTIKIWNTNTWTLITTLTNQNGISALAVLSDCNLASGSYDQTIKIWNVNDWSLIKTITVDYGVSSLVSLVTGDFASLSYNIIQIWNINTGMKSGEIKVTISAFMIVSLPNGNLAVADIDSIYVFDINTELLVQNLRANYAYTYFYANLVVLKSGQLASQASVFNGTTNYYLIDIWESVNITNTPSSSSTTLITSSIPNECAVQITDPSCKLE